MKVLLFDTNSLLRFLLNDIQEQADKTAQMVLKAKKGKAKIIIPQIVIFEIYFALEKFYKLTKEEIINQLEPMILASYFSIEEQDLFIEAIKLFKENNLDLVDCFLFAKGKSQGFELFTFDKKLKNLYKKL